MDGEEDELQLELVQLQSEPVQLEQLDPVQVHPEPVQVHPEPVHVGELAGVIVTVVCIDDPRTSTSAAL
jgi:hypothetical protein